MVHHRWPLVRLLWTEPSIQYQLKFCYQDSQESVRTPWHTWYSVFWQRTTICFQRIQRIWIRLAFWPPNVLTTLSTIKWQDWKCCKDSQEVTNQSKGKWTRSILGHFGLAQHTFTSIGSSPVQRLFGRRTKTLLPTAGTLLQPKIMEGTEDKLKERKTKQALFYNKGTKELPELQPGDTVRMKPLPSDKEKLWRKGSVVKQVAPRSYEVDLQGTMFRRNIRHLVKTKEPWPQLDLESQENLPDSSTPLPVEGPPVMQTRSGRVIHRPGRLRDFV